MKQENLNTKRKEVSATNRAEVASANIATKLGTALPIGARPVDSQKKTILTVSAGLFAIILATTVANTKNKFSNGESAEYSSVINTSPSSRGLASVSTVGLTQSGSEILNKSLTDKLIRELQEGLERQQFARQPTALDKFTFEDLSGQYRINMNNEKISGIELVPGSTRPLQIANTLQFLKDHANFFKAQSINLQSSTTEDGFRYEEFKFKHTNQTESVYQAKLDPKGNLIKLFEVQ